MNLKRYLLALILVPSISYSATYYVSNLGGGNQNGSTWSNAYNVANLQTAIDGASYGDHVWVACGTYLTTTGTDRSISFSMKTGVEIYGGFQGTESLLTEREISCGSCSVLSGEIGNSGNTDNSYKVVYNNTMDSTAVMDGFIIRDGNDDRNPTSSGNGLGGGIYNHGYGFQGHCDPVIRNCIFTNNQASWGAGAFNNGYNTGSTEPTYINCIFHQNHALIEAGGMDSYGVGGTASPLIVNTIFYGNTSATNVGAMYAWGGGQGGNCHPVLVNCLFANNVAQNGYGGAFIANNADQSGGGASGSCTVTLQNCIVRNNTASGDDQSFNLRGNGALVIATNSNVDMSGQSATSPLSGSGNIDVDPQFSNVSNGSGLDNCWLTADDGLRLQSTSLCINSGISTSHYDFDISNVNARTIDGVTDMGPYEYSSITTAVNTFSNNSPYAIAPNPAINAVTILGTNFKEVKWSLYNCLGQNQMNNVHVITGDSKSITFDINKLNPGIYIVSINGSAARFVKK